jgi:hypothetical protein
LRFTIVAPLSSSLFGMHIPVDAAWPGLVGSQRERARLAS